MARSGKQIIGLIPARGSSKRIPRKNLADCGGKPLLAHSFEAARQSRRLDRTILSTDDAEAAELGRQFGIEVPFVRPSDLSRDQAPMLLVMLHALDWLEDDGTSVEALVLLQPTSPLRTARHIDQAVDLFRETPGADSVVSVVEPPHIFHPLKILKPGERGLRPYIDGAPSVQGSRDLPPAYAQNGPAILIVRPATLRRGEVYGNYSVPFLMPSRASIDIDEPFDLEVADFLLRKDDRTGQ